MDRHFLLRELAAFDAGLEIERAVTPPSSWYTSPDFHRLDLEAVLGASWQPVAQSADLAQPGQYVSGILAGEPWVIVRTPEGELRAFHNTCRHKGREVVRGKGCGRELVCGYHAWTYDLTGRLTGAPRMAGIQDFDRQALSLPPIACATFGPWVLLNLSADPEPFEPLGERMQGALDGVDWSRMQLVGERTWTLECDWKVVCDNYLDGGYHIPHMHPSLDAQLEMQTYRTELLQGLSVQRSAPARSSSADLAYDHEERIGGGAHYVWVYPNFMLNRYGFCVDTNYVVPIAPGRCHIHYEFYFEDGAAGPGRARFLEESMEQSAVTQREDIEICESVQVGLASRGYDRGRYAPTVEMGELQFHRLLAASYGRHLERQVADRGSA